MKRVAFSIYEYKSGHEFLRDVFERIKRDRPNYSLRAWAKTLKAKSPTSISRIITGERPIPRSLVPNLCESLGLDPDESAYFEILALCHDRLSPRSFDLIRDSMQARQKARPPAIADPG